MDADPCRRRLLEARLEVADGFVEVESRRFAPRENAGVLFSSLFAVLVVDVVCLAKTLDAAALASLAWVVRGEFGDWVFNMLDGAC